MKSKFNIQGIEFFNLDHAYSLQLIQLTKWLPCIKSEAEYLIKEHIRISEDPDRMAMLVAHKNKIALFVNPVCEEIDEEKS